MLRNDFLEPLLSLSPAIVFAVILIWGFGSILLVAVRTKSVRNRLIRNPGFMIGDLLLIPASGGLIAFFYQDLEKPLPETVSVIWTWGALILGIIISTSLGKKFDLLKKEYLWLWAPHGLFHIFFTYVTVTFITKGFWQLLRGESSLILALTWFVVVFMILAHLRLGAVFPKKLPFEGM